MRLADVPHPQTAVAGAALEVVTAYSSPAVLHHCRRSYVWAAAYAVEHGIAFDAELLWVSAMLHDIGLTPAFDNHAVPFEPARSSRRASRPRPPASRRAPRRGRWRAGSGAASPRTSWTSTRLASSEARPAGRLDGETAGRGCVAWRGPGRRRTVEGRWHESWAQADRRGVEPRSQRPEPTPHQSEETS